MSREMSPNQTSNVKVKEEFHYLLVRYINDQTQLAEATVGVIHSLEGLDVRYLADNKDFEKVDIEKQIYLKDIIEQEASNLYRITEYLKVATPYTIQVVLVDRETFINWYSRAPVRYQDAFKLRFRMIDLHSS